MGSVVRVELDAAEVPRLNRELRRLAAEGVEEIVVRNPGSRHNLAVGQDAPVRIVFDGSCGYYCGGLNAGAQIEVARRSELLAGAGERQRVGPGRDLDQVGSAERVRLLDRRAQRAGAARRRAERVTRQRIDRVERGVDLEDAAGSGRSRIGREPQREEHGDLAQTDPPRSGCAANRS